jgi:hypothetical protein
VYSVPIYITINIDHSFFGILGLLFVHTGVSKVLPEGESIKYLRDLWSIKVEKHHHVQYLDELDFLFFE